MPNYSHGTKLSLASAEEPPYLNVGTDVSAKYKGAFCEAKIIDVNKHVKLRVLFDGSSGSYLIDDADLKAGATLETGSKIEAKHPEKKQQTYVQATITKILDHSRYTVVFDDGDQCVLRRNSLCLKSGKHFAESETLDQLPLTNPEHFGNPVKVGAFEQQQQQNNNQQVSNNSKNSNNNNSNNSSDNNHNSNSGQVSSITSNRLQNNIKHETEKQARGKPTTPVSGGAGRRGVKGRKRRESVNNGSKHAQEPDNDSIDSCPDSADADTSESNVRYDLIEIGVKLMVQYGKGKVQNVYEAKVNKIETTPAGKTRYFVHYTGWNNRYDEWVTKNRIVSIVTEKENGIKDGRSKQSESNSVGSASSNSSAPPSASAKDASSSRERDREKDKDKEKEKEKDKDVSSKTRRSRQSEAVATNNIAVASTTAPIATSTTTTTTTVATTASTTVASSSATASSASSSQSPESQQFSQSPNTISKSETTASRPAATSARQHRQRGENSATAITTTTATTAAATLLASTSPTTTTTTTTTATTASASTTSTTAINNNTTKSSQRTSQQQQTIPSQAIELQEQTTIGRHSSGRRGRALADRLSRESSGEKLTNSVGRRGGNNATSRATSRASTATIGQPEATNQASQLSGRRIKCPDCGAGRCRCRGRRRLLSPATATLNTRESPSPPQQQQMSSASQKPSSPVSSSASATLADDRSEVTPSTAQIDPKVETAPSLPSLAPLNHRAPANKSLVPPKAEPTSNTSDTSDDQSSAEPAKEAHVALATIATSTRDGQSTSRGSVSHSTSGLSSVTTAAETSVISDAITTRDCSSNCDSIGGGSTSSSSASSRSEISERRGSTSTAASNNVESISATSASNISASSSTRRLYSFCEDIEEPDCDKKISILQERIMALRQTYMSLKTELADLDRGRKRPRTERSNSEHITCGVTCRN